MSSKPQNRGTNSWRIKYEIGRDPVTGKRRTAFETVKGTKKDAQTVLAKRMTEMAEGEFVSPSKLTVADYARHWLNTIAPAKAGAKTRERYGEIIETQIIPNIGNIALQKLDGSRIDAFYFHLAIAGRCKGDGGLAPQTVLHIHRLLAQILGSAVTARKLRTSPMLGVQTTPKVHQREIRVFDDNELASLFRHLKGRPLYMPVLLAASTGLRRGEILALRWSDLDLDRATLQVAQVVEQTKEGVRVKGPKTDRSRRTVALPERLVDELQTHRKAQAEWCLKLGLGKSDLVFPSWTGQLQNPRGFSKAFSREVIAAKLPHFTFHGLRHTHITHLLRSGVPVHVVSARAGHANPTVTLNIYAHMLPGQQEDAATMFDATLRAVLED